MKVYVFGTKIVNLVVVGSVKKCDPRSRYRRVIEDTQKNFRSRRAQSWRRTCRSLSEVEAQKWSQNEKSDEMPWWCEVEFVWHYILFRN